MESGIASITQPPVLEERNVNSFCGYWVYPYDATTDYQIWTYWCPSGTQCAIDMSVTPNIIFCPSPGYTPPTSFYEYNSWPKGGCGYREVCCRLGYKTVNKQYDDGATTDNYCETLARTDLPRTMHAMTSFAGYTVQLALWGNDPGTFSSVTPVTSSLPTESIDPTYFQRTPQTGTPQTTFQTSPQNTAQSTNPETPWTTSTTASSSFSSSHGSPDRLGIGAEVGSILGAVFGLVAIGVAVYFGHKQVKQWKAARGASGGRSTTWM